MKPAHSQIVFTALAVLVVLVTAACNFSTPAPTAPPAQPTSAPTAPQATATLAPPTVVPNTPAQPATTSTLAATATVTPTAPPSGSDVVATKPPARGAKLEFTADDIEYAQTPPRKGDNKVQVTITLHPKGGVAPYYFVLDPGGSVETKVKGLTFTFDWHNCGQSEPHSIILYSADGQKVGPVSFMYDYRCG